MSDWRYGPIDFSGNLCFEHDSINVRFSAGINLGGNVIIKLQRMDRTPATKFIIVQHDVGGTRFPQFSLSGEAEGEVKFFTDNLIITSMGNEFSDMHSTICPVVSCSHSTFTMPQAQTGKIGIKWLLLGFENFRPLSKETEVGMLQMAGTYEPVPGVMSGALSIFKDAGEPFFDWKEKADKLLGWVNTVMSFAAAKMLTVPIIELVQDGKLVIEAYAQSERGTTGLRPFAAINQVAIFDCAVNSFLDADVTIKNLDYAVEWFSMKAVHAESNLIFAMTVLENLLDSNLSNGEKEILQKGKFKELKKKLNDVVEVEVLHLYETTEQQQIAIVDYSDKFIDLNRKTLMQKIRLLAEKWNVSLDGISELQITAAKSARDKIVHRGRYTAPAEATHDLHDHLLVMRELIVRFILTAIKYDGNYFTFIDGYIERAMPKIVSK
ncbi:hypothetical protein [Pseudoduganella aquatica]|uniref:ApeA N-terminal domain-containing protein n=1 Tax=Pseudoduganella aquatica TaxID=2660641 RepID=A0A7X4HJ18_9BURK|nr:hypothetical protein [Pseudoduganella aquatica]MYN11387.1 hypothetical protein [Pseudoduganella aquatica]